MNIRRPPAVAAWVLDRLGYTRANPALAGDLLEEIQSGRSAGWYWRQTFIVILLGAARNVAVLQWYPNAVAAGFIAEVAAACTLWRFHLPRPADSIWLGIRESVELLLVECALVVGLGVTRRLIFGRAAIDLKALFAASRSGVRTRSYVVASVSIERFAICLWGYCVLALVCGAPSLDVLIYSQILLLVLETLEVLWRMLNAEGT